MATLRKGSNINGYQIISEPSNDRSGTAIWVFATKSGQDYFIKQFLSPKKPDNRLSDSENERRKRLCQYFEEQRDRRTESFRAISNPHILIPEYISDDLCYYVVTRKLYEVSDSLKLFNMHTPADKLKLLYNIASGVSELHKRQIVHADLKPDNIIFEVDESDTKKRLIPTIIDLDSSFIVNFPPNTEEGIVGDYVYISPEAYKYNVQVSAKTKASEEEEEELVEVTCQSDIFSLGVLFYYFLSNGNRLEFDSKYDYVYQAVREGGSIKYSLHSDYSTKVSEMIASMLSLDWNKRPNIFQVMNTLFFESGNFPKVIGKSKFNNLLTKGLNNKQKAFLKRVYKFNFFQRRYVIVEELTEINQEDLKSIFESLKYDIFDGLERELNKEVPPEFNPFSLITESYTSLLRTPRERKSLISSLSPMKNQGKLKVSDNLKDKLK